jgi:hypothetical protein
MEIYLMSRTQDRLRLGDVMADTDVLVLGEQNFQSNLAEEFSKVPYAAKASDAPPKKSIKKPSVAKTTTRKSSTKKTK